MTAQSESASIVDGQPSEPCVLRVPVLCYSRIVGYYAATVNWNVGKKAEFAERVPFDVTEVVADDNV